MDTLLEDEWDAIKEDRPKAFNGGRHVGIPPYMHYIAI
jgi:hypothetical protein